MFLKRALSFKPNFQATSAWHSHKAFACELIFRLKPKCFVELGVHHGDSYFAFCQAVKENNLSTICYGIDHWEGDQQAGEYSNDVYEKVISYNHLNFSNFSYLIKDDFKSASKQFCDQSIDLCHIDGSHTFDCVSEDWKTWKPKIKKDGIVLFHDILEKKAGFGVWKLWEKLRNDYPTFTFKFGSGLGVLQLSDSSTDIAIDDDFILSEKDHENVNNLFLFCDKTNLLNLENDIKDLQNKIGEFEHINKVTFDENYHLKKVYKDLQNKIGELEHINKVTFDENYHLKKVYKNELELHHEINVIKSSLNFSKAKCEQYRKSFSWKITMPLRLLRRNFVDPFRTILTNKVSYDKSYENWINKYDSNAIFEKNELKTINQTEEKTKFSIILPVYDPPLKLLAQCIESVLSQIYNNWELCIVDDNSKNPLVLNLIKNFSRTDSRIRYQCNKVNRHISLTSNRACSFATGDFFVFLDHDDLLRQHTLFECFLALKNNCCAEIIYSDEDKIDLIGNRKDPYFKPDWNPFLLRSQNYLCHLLVIKRNLFYKAGCFRKGYEGSQDWDLALRATKIAIDTNIIHIPKILYHWRVHDNSVSNGVESKSYAISSAVKAIDYHLKDSKVFSHCSIVNEQYCRSNYRKDRITKSDSVSIIIPTKDNSSILENCIHSIFQFTKNVDFEVLIINNASTDSETLMTFEKLSTKYENLCTYDYEKDFNFSAINNFAVKKARNENLLFLNDDTEIVNEDWLFELVCQLTEKEVGAVGAKLYYPSGDLQHCGVLLGYCGVAGEFYKGKHALHPGQMQRANLLQNVSAVTGACLAIRKKVFLEVGGFDQVNLPIAFNDIDLCLKLLEKGYRNVFTPYSHLIHHESLSRGSDLSPKRVDAFKRECDHMKSRWKEKLQFDNSYNPNLSLNSNEQFEFSFPPRESQH